MVQVTSIVGFADFSARLPLHDVAKLLSEALFAGIPFVGKDQGIWDEVSAIRLERDFLGLQITMGGSEQTGYTLEIDTTLSALCDSSVTAELPTVCDVSHFLKGQLARIPGITLLAPRY